jgi:hypothetical protein
MNKPILSLISVWCAALSAAALAYVVHRPAAVAAAAPRMTAMAAVRAPARHRRAVERVDRVIVIPEQVIVSHERPATAPIERPAGTTKCTEWRSLRQGSATQLVRDCR